MPPFTSGPSFRFRFRRRLLSAAPPGGAYTQEGMSMSASSPVYAFLGPQGTFTEAALLQVPGAAQSTRVPASNVNAALDKVRDGSVHAAMVPIENSVEGGVTATLDAIAGGGELRIIREV